MKFISCPAREDCDEEAVSIITQILKETVKKKKQAVMAIPGGSSVLGIFSRLKSISLQEPNKIPWKQVHIFLVDERLVLLTSKESNYRLAEDNFLRELKERKIIPEENIHPFREEKGIEKYQEELQGLGGRYDLAILSSGEDGHVGALFPHHPSVQDPAPFFITMKDSPKPPPGRMTSSLSLLQRAEAALLLFYGPSKKEAYLNFKDRNKTLIDCPAKLVWEVKRSYVIVDN